MQRSSPGTRPGPIAAPKTPTTYTPAGRGIPGTPNSASSRNLLASRTSSVMSRSPAGNDDSPGALFERVTSAVSSEQMAARVAVLKTQLENDPAYVAAFGSILVSKEYAWLAVMQRAFNDFSANEPGSLQCRHDIVEVLVLLASREDSKLRSVLAANKLSSILTVPGSAEQRGRAVRAVLACANTATDIDHFLSRMQGYENVAEFVAVAPLDIAAGLVATLVGKAPTTARGMADNEIDTRLLRAAFKALPDLSKLTGAFHRVLYALRFFVRVKANNFMFAERCLSLCAHAAQHLAGPAAELAADVCQTTTDTSFTGKHPNILANLCAACQFWSPAKTGALHPRTPTLASFLARIITAHEKGVAMFQAATRCYRACTALVRAYAPGAEASEADARTVGMLTHELLALVLHAALCVMRTARPREASAHLDFVHLRSCRAALWHHRPTDGSAPSAATRGAGERWLSLLWALQTHACSCALNGLLDPVSRFVDEQILDAAAVQRATGQAYDPQWFADRDAQVAARVADMRAPALAIDEEATRSRAAAYEAEGAARKKIARRFASELAVLKTSARQRYFDAMVLPGCLHIRNDYARADAMLKAAAEQGLERKSSGTKGGIDEADLGGGHSANSPRAREALLARHESSRKITQQWSTARAGATGAGGGDASVVLEHAMLPILQSLERSVLDRRSAWHAQQQAVVWRARATHAAERMARAGANSLLLLELEEEASRGLGWHGITYSAAPDRETRDNADTMSPRGRSVAHLSLTPIAVQEAEARARLVARWQEIVSGNFDNANPAASFRLSPRKVAGRSWRIKGVNPTDVIDANMSMTSIADASFGDWLVRYGRAHTGTDGINHEERAKRSAILLEAMGGVAVIQVECHEESERMAIVDAHGCFLAVAALALESPAALNLVLREAPVVGA